jgi:hypothetical protein
VLHGVVHLVPGSANPYPRDFGAGGTGLQRGFVEGAHQQNEPVHLAPQFGVIASVGQERVREVPDPGLDEQNAAQYRHDSQLEIEVRNHDDREKHDDRADERNRHVDHLSEAWHW